MIMATEESRALMRHITGEIWNNGRLELINQLIVEDLLDPGPIGASTSEYRRPGLSTYRRTASWRTTSQ